MNSSTDADAALLEGLRTRATIAESVVHELASWDDLAELASSLADGRAIALTPSLRQRRPELAATLEGQLIAPDDDDPFGSVADVAVGVVEGVLAVAETGSVLLAQGDLGDRAVGMLSHTCIHAIEVDRVVPTLDDAMRWLAEHAGEHPLATLVTGPSRTADIERSLTIGVQGPSELHLAVIG